jgi:hypothetical protein
MTTASFEIKNNYKVIVSRNIPSEDRGMSAQASILKTHCVNAVKQFTQPFTTGQKQRELTASIFLLLQNIAVLPEQNDEGVNPPNHHTILNALKFASLIPSKYPNPEIDVDPDGEVSFEWYIKPSQILTASIRSDGRIVYAGLNDMEKVSGKDYLKERFPSGIAAFLDELF